MSRAGPVNLANLREGSSRVVYCFHTFSKLYSYGKPVSLVSRLSEILLANSKQVYKVINDGMISEAITIHLRNKNK